MRLCLRCKNPVAERNGNARYCSHECYLEAKRVRDQQAYIRNTSLTKLVSANDAILASFFKKGAETAIISVQTLMETNFEFGLSLGETFYMERIYKVLNRFCYYVDLKTQMITICKFNSAQSQMK